MPDEFTAEEKTTGLWWRQLVAGGGAGAGTRGGAGMGTRMGLEGVQVQGWGWNGGWNGYKDGAGMGSRWGWNGYKVGLEWVQWREALLHPCEGGGGRMVGVAFVHVKVHVCEGTCDVYICVCVYVQGACVFGRRTKQ